MRPLPPILAVVLAALSAPLAAAEPVELEGEYAVVALRRAADAAGGPGDDGAKDALGKRVYFGDALEWLDGTTCDAWSATVRGEPVMALDDPNLSDIQLAPDGIEDARLNRSLTLACGAREVASVLQVDRRVLVVRSPSGLTHLVLERVPRLAEIDTAIEGLTGLGLFAETAGATDMDTGWRRALAVHAAQLGARYAFARGVLTENLFAVLSDQAAARGREHLKTVRAGRVAAHFKGVREEVAPLEFGVREIWFEFAGDSGRYVFKPAEELHFSDWFFAVFSTGGSFVLLPHGHYGPFHVVRTAHLKDYLLGRRQADEVIGQPADAAAPARVLGDAEWLSDTEFSYTAGCCGETVEHRHSVRFLDYRPKETPDTVFDYRPALSLVARDLPPFSTERIPALVARMERLVAAARAAPGRFEAGNAALGANPQEYVPSDEELLAARFGDALGDLLNGIEPDATAVSADADSPGPRTLIYHRFIYRHVDVMGSGRFFYASPPIPVVIEIGRTRQ